MDTTSYETVLKTWDGPVDTTHMARSCGTCGAEDPAGTCCTESVDVSGIVLDDVAPSSDPVAMQCDACGAVAHERCRPGCLGEAVHLDEGTAETLDFRNGAHVLRRMLAFVAERDVEGAVAGAGDVADAREALDVLDRFLSAC